ncbi:MAG: amidohydrolase family protein [Gammaproteobacteria bacterium]|nr:amidohydrolase family protein [Gammaproteobacteria bacterium]
MNLLKTLFIVSLAGFSLAAQSDAIMIRGATVHTMTEDGTLENTDVFISGGEIQRIGKDLPVPQDDVYVFNAGGKPLTPGFFAGISSIGITEVSAVEESSDSSLALKEMRPEFDVVPAYNPNSTLVPVNRIEGFSFTLLGAGAKGSIFGGQGQIVALDGGYESFAGKPVLFINVGRDASRLSGGSRAAQWMLLDQAMSEADSPPTSNEAILLTRAGRGTLATYASDGKVVFNVDRASDILETLRFAKRFGLDPVISGGAEAWMVARQLASAKVPVLLDPLVNLPGNFDSLGARLDNAAILEAAGVTVVINGAGSHDARRQRQMAGNAVSHGLPHDAGIAALTSNPARVFGVSDQQGRIQNNNAANVVLWSGDPLEVTSAAEIVVINGKLIPMESRQTKLRDRYLPENPEMPRAYIKP